MTFPSHQYRMPLSSAEQCPMQKSISSCIQHLKSYCTVSITICFCFTTDTVNSFQLESSGYFKFPTEPRMILSAVPVRQTHCNRAASEARSTSEGLVVHLESRRAFDTAILHQQHLQGKGNILAIPLGSAVPFSVQYTHICRVHNEEYLFHVALYPEAHAMKVLPQAAGTMTQVLIDLITLPSARDSVRSAYSHQTFAKSIQRSRTKQVTVCIDSAK